MTKKVVKLKAPPKRVETGVVQFENDWPGIFIRGDNALGLAQILLMVKQTNRTSFLNPIIELLLSCDVLRCKKISKNIWD